MRHLWRVGRWSSSSTERGSLGGSVNPAPKGARGREIVRTMAPFNMIMHPICEGTRRRDTTFAPRSCWASRPCAHVARAAPTTRRGRALVPALASLRPQLRLPKSLISSTRSGW